MPRNENRAPPTEHRCLFCGKAFHDVTDLYQHASTHLGTPDAPARD